MASPRRNPSTAPAAVHDSQIDLATASFTTTEPFVLRIYTGESPEEERFMEQLADLGAIAAEVRLGRAKPEDLDEAMAALNKAHRGMGTARVLGAHEAAKFLGVTPGHVGTSADRGEIGKKIDDDNYRFSRAELEVHKNRPRNKGGRPPKHIDRKAENAS